MICITIPLVHALGLIVRSPFVKHLMRYDVIICMTRTTFPKDLQVKAATSTPVECFSPTSEPSLLIVTLAHDEKEISDFNKAFAKSPDGDIVEVAFTSASVKPSSSIQIVYNIW